MTTEPQDPVIAPRVAPCAWVGAECITAAGPRCLQAAFPFFRDTSSPDMEPACLVRYFDDTRVETLLTVYDSKSGAQLAEAAMGEAFIAIKKALRTTAEAGLLASGAVPGEGVKVPCSAE